MKVILLPSLLLLIFLKITPAFSSHLEVARHKDVIFTSSERPFSENDINPFPSWSQKDEDEATLKKDLFTELSHHLEESLDRSRNDSQVFPTQNRVFSKNLLPYNPKKERNPGNTEGKSYPFNRKGSSFPFSVDRGVTSLEDLEFENGSPAKEPSSLWRNLKLNDDRPLPFNDNKLLFSNPKPSLLYSKTERNSVKSTARKKTPKSLRKEMENTRLLKHPDETQSLGKSTPYRYRGIRSVGKSCHFQHLKKCGKNFIENFPKEDAPSSVKCDIREEFLDCMVLQRKKGCSSLDESMNSSSDPEAIRSEIKTLLWSANGCLLF